MRRRSSHQWIARDRDAPPYLRSHSVDELVAHHCDQRVLRWHRLCNPGD